MFDRTVGLDAVPDDYRAMADRGSIKVMVHAVTRDRTRPRMASGLAASTFDSELGKNT